MSSNICSNTNLRSVSDVNGLIRELNFIRRKVCEALTTNSIPGIVEFADNAAALAGGLTDSDVYRTGDTLKIVHT